VLYVANAIQMPFPANIDHGSIRSVRFEIETISWGTTRPTLLNHILSRILGLLWMARGREVANSVAVA